MDRVTHARDPRRWDRLYWEECVFSMDAYFFVVFVWTLGVAMGLMLIVRMVGALWTVAAFSEAMAWRTGSVGGTP